MKGASNSGRITVDLGAVAQNYRDLKQRSRGDCAGVVKANGYGLGLQPIAQTLATTGCDIFFVATLAEALSLRELLPARRTLLLGGLADAESAQQAADAGVEPVLNSPQQALTWLPFAGNPAVLHVDTGMQRLGFTPAELAEIDWRQFNLSLLMTHLACADVPDHPANAQQLVAFKEVVARFPGIPSSIANSAGCLLPEEWHGDLTRPGIGLYGGHPQNRIEGNPLTPVIQVEGQVLARRRVAAGTPIGYGGSFVPSRDTELAVVGLGYADGLPRLLSSLGEVTIAGRRAPIAGRVSMDLTHIDITDLLQQAPQDTPAVGDWVEFMGADISVDEVAQWADTIGLEILCGLGQRPVWRYLSA